MTMSRTKKFDGMIVTGAPVEMMDFEEVDYWDELCKIFDWAKTNVYSTFNICWGAQAALYYNYGIPKHLLPEKVFGVFRHQPLDLYHPLLRGFSDVFYVPHSRHTENRKEDIIRVRIFRFCLIPRKPGFISCRIWRVAIFTVRVIANMIVTPWLASTSAI